MARRAISEQLEQRLYMSGTADQRPTPHVIALIDQTLPDQAMLASSLPDSQIISYDPSRQSAAEVLSEAIRVARGMGGGVTSVMIFSHGATGEFALGSDVISADNLDQQSSEWKALGQYLAPDATIDLFSCDTAAGPSGQALLDRLHATTGAHVLGSTNLTGKDGDWTLEGASSETPESIISASPLRVDQLSTFSADLSLSFITPAAATPSTVTGTSTLLSVTVLDTLGTPSYAWSVTSQPSGSNVTFSANNSSLAATTTATFNKAGAYTFSMTATHGAATLTSAAVNVTVNQTLTSIVVTPGTPALALNGVQVFAATAYDQFSNAMTAQPTFTWSKLGVGTLSGSTLTAGSIGGLATITANSGLVSGSTIATVANTAPTVAAAAAASPATVTGSTTALSVLGADDNGESNLLYTWSVTSKPSGASPTFSANLSNAAKASTVTFDKAGSYTFLVTIMDGGLLTTTSSVSVTVNQTLTSIVVSPATNSLNLNGSQQLTATGYDQFGNTMTSPPTFTWTKSSGVGSVGSSGLYSAGTAAGTAVLQAASGAVSGTAGVTVTNAAPTLATAAAASSSFPTGTTVSLSALGADDNGESNLTYTWAATLKPSGSSPSFSANGTNAAKNATVTFDKYGTYTFQVSISDGTNAVTSAVSVVVSQTLTSITVTPAASALFINGSTTISSVANDQFGAAMVLQPIFFWNTSAGSFFLGTYTAPSTATTATVTVSAGGVSGSTSITVSDAAPTVATPASASPSTVTASTTTLSVLGADDGGESNLTYTWAATTKPAGASPSFSANSNNAAKSSTVTFDKAGNYTFTVTISDGSHTATSAVSVVVNQTLTSIVVSPAAPTLALNAVQALSATAYDQFGSAMAAQPTFTWSKLGVGTLSSSTFTAGSVTGLAAVTATSGLVSGSDVVTVANTAPTVAVAAAASPATVTSSTTALSVLGTDDNSESNLTYFLTVTSKPGGASPTFSANLSNAAKNTTVTFDKAGSYTFLATISDGLLTTTSSVTVTVNQTLSSIAVSPASNSLNLNGAQQLTAVGYDQFGAAMAAQPTVTWTKSSGVGSVSSSGLYTAASTAGTATIQPASGAVSGTGSVTVTNASPTVATAAAASSSFPTGTTVSLSALGADDNGESNLTYTWSATLKPSGSSPSFSANGTNAAKNATVTFDRFGIYTFQVAISDGTTTVTSACSVVVSQTLSSIVVSPSSNTLPLNGGTFVSATGYDQFGAALVLQPLFSWNTSAGLYVLGAYIAPSTATTATITASSGGVSGSANILVSDSAPTVATGAAASPSTVTGTNSTLSVLGADDGGESNLTYTWAATLKPIGASPTFSANGTNAAKSATVTFNKAGAYTLTVTISDGSHSTTSSVAVTVSQTLTSVVATPTSSSVNLNGSTTLSAVAYDQFGVALVVQPTFTWSASAGTVSGATYTAPAATASATVTATASGISGSTTIAVSDASPTVATAAAASPAVVTGGTTVLTALGADDSGESNLTYTWAATLKPIGASPTFSANGTNAAKSSTVTFDKAGNYAFTVTISDGTHSTTSTVGVVVSQTLASIVVTPVLASLSLNGTTLVAAVGYDQFNVALTIQPLFTWSCSSGGFLGSLFTAPSSGTIATVTASLGGISASASITISNSTPTVAAPASASPLLVTGGTTALSALGADDNGEANLTYTWAATTKPSGASPTFSANGTNAAKNATVTFDRAGVYGFTVTISDGTASVTSTVAVTVNQTMTSVAVSPTTAAASLNQIDSFSATAYDQFSRAMLVQPAIAWSIDSGGVGAIDAFGSYASSTTGSATVRATAGGVSGSASVTVTNATPTVANAAAATSTSINGASVALSVLGADDGGESHLTYTWSAIVKPIGASPTFSASGTNAAKNATVTFDMAGSYTLRATISDGTNSVTSNVNVTVNQTLTSVVVTPVIASLALNGATAVAAVGFDQFGAALLIQPSFTWSSSSGTYLLGTFTASNSAGSATVTATAAGVSGSATITVADSSPTIANVAAASPANVTGTTTALAVLGADDGGESNLTYTWTATLKPAGAMPSFSANGTNAAKNATVMFDKAGVYAFTVTISDGSHAATSSVAVAVGQTLTSITVTPVAPALPLDGSTIITATGYDQFGNAMLTPPTFTWTTSGGSVSAGVFTAPASATTATVTATVGGIHASATISVSDSTPTVATPASASPSTVTGSTADLSALGADDGGEANLTYTWAETVAPLGASPAFSANGTNAAKATTVTFDRAGTYAFTVVISDGTFATTSSVAVVVSQTLSSVSVSPASTSVALNSSTLLSATGFDQFGAAMVSQPTFAWSATAGTVTAGNFTAGNTAGNVIVTAAAGGLSGTSNVTVSDTAPTVAVSAAASPAVVGGTTTALTVLGADDGGESHITYTWAVTTKPSGASPAFSANGTNGAKAATVTFDHAGAYVFTVTISDGTSSTTSSVAVTVAQTVTSIAVSAGASALPLNGATAVSATAYDQFGAAVLVQPALTWTASTGSIVGGLFTAPGAIASATVTASAGSVHGSVSITIADTAPSVAAPASASPAIVTGTGTTLAVLGADDGGESALTYTWSATTKPTGASPVFSLNGTNNSKNASVLFDRAGAYVLTVTMSDGASSVTSSVAVAVSQTLTSIVVSPGSASLSLNQTQSLSATANDQFGQAMLIQPAITWSVDAGGAGGVDALGQYASASAGTAVVRATAGAISGAAAMTTTNASPTIAVNASATPGSVSGTSAALAVLGADDGGESHLTYTWAATTAPAGASPAFSANGSNAAKASVVTFDKAGAYVLTVTVSDGSHTTTSAVSVNVSQTLTSIAVSPTSPTVNENAGVQFSAVAKDQFGVAMSSQPALAWSAVAGQIDSSGHYTGPSAAGADAVTATAGLVTGTAAVTIQNAAPTVAVAAAASPATVTGATAALSVLGADDGGESNLTYTWAATTKPAGASPAFSANTTNAAKNVTVTFNTAGSYTFAVTITGGVHSVVSTVSVTVSQTLTTITVSPATGAVNENASLPFTAVALDQFGDSLAAQPTFTWSVASGPGAIDSGGLFASGATTGSAVVHATSGGVTGVGAVTVSNAAPTVASTATASPASVTGTTAALTVIGADDGGEANLTYTWAATIKPAGASPAFSDNGSNGSKLSIVTFDRAGTYLFTVTISDGTNATTSSVAVTVGQQLASITVNSTTGSISQNGVVQLSAVSVDQFGQTMLIPPVIVWGAAGVQNGISSAGLFTAGTSPGTYLATATSGLISGTKLITIVDAAPTIAAGAAATPAPVTGVTVSLSALGADDAGESTLTYTWAATTKPAGSSPAFSIDGTNAAKNATVTFDRAGHYVFTVTISDGTHAVTSSVSVTVEQTLTSLAVTPASATVNLNSAQPLSAVAYDQFGDAMLLQPAVTWSKTAGVGSVSAGGLFSSQLTAGAATIEAASGAVSSLAVMTVVDASPTIAVAAFAASGSTGASLQVLGADDAGESHLTYTWAVDAQPAGSNVSFTSNGDNTAKATAVSFSVAGSYQFTVTVSDGTNSAASSVSVTVPQTVASIVVTPASSAVNLQGTTQFAATVYDQFGAAMHVQPTVSFSLAAGPGSVNSSGLFTAGIVAGTSTILVSTAGVSTTASVVVGNAAPTLASAIAAGNTTVTGTATSLSALGADDAGETHLTYTWSIGSAPVGASPTFSANGGNAAKATSVTFDRAGAYVLNLTIADANGALVTSSINLTVVQTLTSIVVSPAANTLSLGDTEQLTADAVDQFGLAMNAPSPITWTVTTGGGTIDSAGLFSAPATADHSTVTASVAGVTGSATITTVDTATIAASLNAGGTAASLSVVGVAGSGLTFTWATVAKPAGAADPVFSDSGTTTALHATAAFNAAGDYDLSVTVSDGVTTTVLTTTVHVTAQLQTITVTPASASLNENQSTTFSAVGADQFGDALAISPNWAVISGSGAIDSSGTFTAPAAAGSVTVRADAAGVSATATISISNAVPTIATGAAASQTVVTGTSVSLSVLGADDGGESALTYTWSLDPAAPSGVSFSQNSSHGARQTTATFSQAGAYNFTVTISDGTTTVTDHVSVTVQKTASFITLAPATATVALNQSQPITATVDDQFGNTIASPPAIAWSVTGAGSIDSNGVYTSAAPGSATVHAAIGSVEGTAALTAQDGTPTLAAAATWAHQTDSSVQVSVLGADDGGEAGLTYTWSVVSAPAGATVSTSDNATNSAKLSTVTFNRAGHYTLLATISDGANSVTSSVSFVVTQVLSSLVVTPATATINENGSQAFAAQGFDQFGISLAAQPSVTWAVDSGSGTIDANGVYTAGNSAGAASISATALGISVTTAITVSDAAPTLAAPAAATTTTVTGASVGLSAMGADDGAESGLTYTWSVAAAPAGASPVFSLNGTNAAKNTAVTFDHAGAYAFTVTISDGQSTVTSTVHVTVDQTLTAISVLPTSTTVNQGDSAPFTATAFDQFGDALAAQPAFTWSILSGVGSIDSSGVYTASGASGTATVQAAIGSVVNVAVITVNDAAPTLINPPTIVSQTDTSADLSALGADDAGEAALTYTWTVTSAPPNATPTMSDNGSNAAKHSTVTFNRAGVYSLRLAVSDGTSQVISNLTVTVAQVLTALSVTPPSASVGTSGTARFTAAAHDQFGDALVNQPAVSWSVSAGGGSVDSTGVYSALSTPGSATVEAAAGPLTATASISIIAGLPIVTLPPAATALPGDPAAMQLDTLGDDANGESGLTYTWSVLHEPAGANATFTDNGDNAAKHAVVRFNKAGAYSLEVTLSNGSLSTTETLTINVAQVLTALAVSPPATTTAAGGRQTFTATAFDQFFDEMAVSPAVTWTVSQGAGSVDSAGAYTAPSVSGAATVTASAGGLSADAAVTILPTGTTLQSPATAVVQSPTTVDLQALAAGQNLVYTWTLTGQPAGSSPAFSANGSAAARNTTATFDHAGQYTLLVTITGDAGTVQSAVTIDIAPVTTRLVISPAQRTMYVGRSKQFSVAGLDQFGDAIALGSATWSLQGGSVGAVDGNGLFSSNDVGGATLLATSAGITASAVVTVRPRIWIQLQAYASQPSTDSPLATLHAVIPSAVETPEFTYTWELVSASGLQGQPAVSAGPAAVTFSANGTLAAKYATATFAHAGTYVLRVTATDGVYQGSEDVTVHVTYDAGLLTTRMVSSVDPTVANGAITGFVVTFNGALDPTTAQNVAGYRIMDLQKSQAGRSWIKRLFGQRAHTRSKYVAVTIASAVYDAQTFTVTLTLARPISNGHRQWKLNVFGSGASAVLDDQGRPIDAFQTGRPGGVYSAHFTTAIGSNVTFTTVAHDRVHLSLDGQGTFITFLPAANRRPSLWMSNTAAPSSTLVGHVITHDPGNVVTIDRIVNASMVHLNLAAELNVEFLAD